MNASTLKNEILEVKHTAGFFSCCTVKLAGICHYFRDNDRKLPKEIRCVRQFRLYKVPTKLNKNITSLFFTEDKYIDVEMPTSIQKLKIRCHNLVFKTWVPFDYLAPFVKKYFTPSDYVQQIIKEFEEKSSIDYSNTIAVYYRGLDKKLETQIAPYEEFIAKAERVLKQNPNAKFLLQTDETEFKEAFLKRFPHNSFCNEELPTKNKPLPTEGKGKGIHYDTPFQDRPRSGALILSMAVIMSKCKTLILSTSNVSFWTVLYRGNCKDVYQWKTNCWYKS